MRRNHGTLLVLLLLLLVVSRSSSRLLKPIDSAMEENGIITRAASSSDDPATDFSNLMGADVEECGDQSQEDEECVKRRMIAEAHLDYIYTQHHKP